MLQPVLRDPLASDFTLVFIAVRIGTEHGWSHIYSLQLQHQLFSELRPGVFFNDGQRFIAPPPLAWVTLPLAGLGGAGAFYAWTALSIGALGAAWWFGAPGRGLEKAVWLIGAIAWYPVLYGLQYGQPALVVLLTVIACWWLGEGRRPYLAGLVLAVGTSFKPQLVLAVPLVLLVGGRWRIVAAWLAAAGALAVLSLLSLGASGLDDYRSLLAEAQALPNNRYFTWAYVLGPGALSYLAQGVVLVAAAAGAYLNRAASTGRLLALGLLAGAAGATYWHLQDFTILVGAAWLFWRDNPPAWQRTLVAVTAVTIELAWPLTPVPLLIGTAFWLGLLVYPAKKAVPQVA